MMTDAPSWAQAVDIRAIWNADLHTLGCAACDVAYLVPVNWESPRCPACLSEHLVPQPARLRLEPPELVVPFDSSLTHSALSLRLEEWLRGVWLRPADLQIERLVSRLMRVYVPMWLVDGKVEGIWGARMGFDYQVESTQERYDQTQGWQSQRLTETRVRWEPRIGRLSRTYHNLAVPALEKHDETALKARLGPYQLDRAVAYTAAAVADVAMRVPSLLPEEAWPPARAALEDAAFADCQRATSAQHSDEFRLKANYEDLNWTQLLLPLYATYYQDDTGQVVSVWVNGQSGHIGGVRRASIHKATRIAGVVVVVAALNFVLGTFLALLDAETVGSLLMTLGFFLALAAVVPIFWAWQFNQTQNS
jgi:hypothetical protein